MHLGEKQPKNSSMQVSIRGVFLNLLFNQFDFFPQQALKDLLHMENLSSLTAFMIAKSKPNKV